MARLVVYGSELVYGFSIVAATNNKQQTTNNKQQTTNNKQQTAKGISDRAWL